MSLELAIFFFLVLICSVTQVLSISGGLDAKLGQYPYYVGIYINNIPGGYKVNPIFQCGGGILNEQWILTAAYCINSIGKTEIISVKAGNIYTKRKTDTEQWSNVTAAFIPPFNDKNFGSNDIGLLKLKTPLKFNEYVSPISLADIETPSIGNATIVGLGLLKNLFNDQAQAKILQTVTLPLISQDECAKLVFEQLKAAPEIVRKYFDDSTICTGPTEKNQGYCVNDTGGPLVIEREDKKILIGIASYVFAPDCENPGIPSLYTGISYFKNWINQTMEINSNIDIDTFSLQIPLFKSASIK